MVGLVCDEEKFGARVGVVEFLAKLRGDDGVLRREDDGDRALIIFKPFPGRVLVAHDPTDGEDRVMVLCDIGEAVKRGEEEKSFDAVGVCCSSSSGDACADGLAEDDDGCPLRDIGRGFAGGGQEGFFRGAAAACAVAGVFEEVNRDGVVGRSSTEKRGVVGAMHGVASIAVENEESEGWTGIGGRWEAAVADYLALRIPPWLETLVEGFALENGGVVFGREVDHRSLREGEEGEESEPDQDRDTGDLPEAV